MIAASLSARLRRIEQSAAPSGRVVVVSGSSQAELDAKAAALITSGEASERDLILCIRKFAPQTVAEAQS